MTQVKGLSTALRIAMIALVLLIVAVVILTIFADIIFGVSSLAEARNNCDLQAQTTCDTSGSLPVTWGVKSARTDQGVMSCQELKNGCASCQECGYI